MAEKKKSVKSTAYSIIIVLFVYTAILEIAMIVLNLLTKETWGLFWYDLKSGFIDNPRFLRYFLPFAAVGFIIILLLTIFKKNSISLKWNFCIKGKNKEWRMKIGTPRFIKHLGWIMTLFMTVFIAVNMKAQTGSYNVWEGSTLVGHSFGKIDEYAYTGSLEAFYANYERGYRTFEVDLYMTSDNKVVLRHDWDHAIQENISSENIPTEEEFLKIPLCGRYTPMTFGDLCNIMKEYPDIWIVTDSKYIEKEEIEIQFQDMIDTARKLGAEEVLDRLIIQIYNEEMYETLKDIYPFKSFIFTLYQRWNNSAEQFTELSRWCVANDVDVFTIDAWKVTEEILDIAERYQVDVYVHTVNDSEVAQKFLDEGVRGIYTDSINPEEVEEKR